MTGNRLCGSPMGAGHSLPVLSTPTLTTKLPHAWPVPGQLSPGISTRAANAAGNVATGAKGASSLEGLWHSAPNTDKNLQHRPKSQPAQALQLARVSRRPLLVWVWNKGLGRGPVFLHSCLIRRRVEGWRARWDLPCHLEPGGRVQHRVLMFTAFLWVG